jgi:hypothetical protein
MRPLRLLLAVTLLAALLLAIPAAAQEGGVPNPPASPTPTPVPLSDTCRDTVSHLAALTGGLTTPEHLQQENAVKTADDFDVNEYFSVLDHLAMQEGYTLDYVYAYEFLGGRPILYARPSEQEPYQALADFPRVEGDSQSGYLDRVVIDDTPEGYLQFVALDVMGEQFYLVWHANYNDYRILCDSTDVEDILDSDNEFGQPIPDDVAAQARQLDVEPVVELGEDTAQVQVVVFTKWGGFLRVTFTISRDFPRRVFDAEAETLVAYDCGVMF